MPPAKDRGHSVEQALVSVIAYPDKPSLPKAHLSPQGIFLNWLRVQLLAQRFPYHPPLRANSRALWNLQHSMSLAEAIEIGASLDAGRGGASQFMVGSSMMRGAFEDPA